MTSNPIRLRKGYSSRGADMGRCTIKPLHPWQPLKMRMERLRLDSGGYDRQGAYWGHDTVEHKQVYFAQSVDEVPVEVSYGEPMSFQAQIPVWAKTRAEAKALIRESWPGARFFR